MSTITCIFNDNGNVIENPHIKYGFLCMIHRFFKDGTVKDENNNDVDMKYKIAINDNGTLWCWIPNDTILEDVLLYIASFPEKIIVYEPDTDCMGVPFKAKAYFEVTFDPIDTPLVLSRTIKVRSNTVIKVL